MIVTICPAAVTSAAPSRVWEALTRPDGFGDWMDATFVSATPPGMVQPGVAIHLSAPALGRRWPVSVDVIGVDAESRWVDLRAHLPFGITNHERVSLTETKDGGTLVRFN